MAYIDDFYGTPADEQRRLKELCGNPWCSHMRYLHGDTMTVKDGPWKTINHTPGKCSNCKCREYADSPITRDVVLDAHEALKAEIHLADVGIGPLMCAQVITRWNGLSASTHVCLLEKRTRRGARHLVHEHHVQDDKGWWACFAHGDGGRFKYLFDHEPSKITRWLKEHRA